MSQFLDDMLFGASVTAPHQGTFFDGPERACAAGAHLIGQFFRINGRMPLESELTELKRGAYHQHYALYNARYGVGVGRDNDTYGRDFVIQRFKEMEADGDSEG